MQKKKPNKIVNTLKNKKTSLVNAARVEDAIRHIKHLHRTYDGYITLAIKQSNKNFKSWNQYHFKVEELEGVIHEFLNEENVYISNNQFWTARRRIKDIRHLTSLWQDIDYYNIDSLKGKTAEELIQMMKEQGKFEKIGEPSFYIYSGNGLYLFWLIESSPKQMLPLWQMCQNALFEMFEEFGADPKSLDAPHVFRLCGSINSKTEKLSKLIIDSSKMLKIEQEEDIKVYNLQHFIDVLLPEIEDYHNPLERKEFWKEVRKEKKQKKRQLEQEDTVKVKKIKSMFNLQTLHYNRLEDLVSLLELRKQNGEHDGYRELVIFLYRYWSCCYIRNKEQALKDALEINKMFKEPLDLEEVIEGTESANAAYEHWLQTLNEYYTKGLNKKYNTKQTNEYFHKKGCYVYSNKKLIKKLKITDEEMREAELRTIISTKVKNERSESYRSNYYKANREKYNEYYRQKRRNKNGLTPREQEKQNKMKLIEELLIEGKKQKEISEILGLDKSVISRYVKEIRSIKENENIAKNEVEVRSYRIDTSDVTMIIAS